MVVAATPKTTGANEQSPRIYRHVKRPEWGAAIVVWERNGQFACQFEDGELRIFRKGYQHLFEEVDRPADVAADLAAKLASKLEVSTARRRLRAEAARKGRQPWTLRDQVKVFRLEYPRGFSDPAWEETIRGKDAKSSRKQHRDSAAARAARLLSGPELAELTEAGQFEEVVNRARKVARATSLVTPKELKPLAELPESAYQPFVTALRDLLHGEGPYGDRFDAFVQCLEAESGKPCNWPLATLFPALVHPENQVSIKRNTFQRQARWLAPRLKIDPNPSSRQYERMLRIAKTLQERLEKVKFSPRDLLDIYDFVRLTTRSSARRVLEENKDTD